MYYAWTHVIFRRPIPTHFNDQLYPLEFFEIKNTCLYTCIMPITYVYTHTHIYIAKYTCVCVCVRLYFCSCIAGVCACSSAWLLVDDGEAFSPSTMSPFALSLCLFSSQSVIPAQLSSHLTFAHVLKTCFFSGCRKKFFFCLLLLLLFSFLFCFFFLLPGMWKWSSEHNIFFFFLNKKEKKKEKQIVSCGRNCSNF